MSQLLGDREAALADGAHGSPQRHVPRVDDLAQPVGSVGEGGDLVVGLGDETGLEERDDAKAAPEELQAGVVHRGRARQDLRGRIQAALDVCGAGDHVAPRRQRVAEGERVTRLTSGRDRLLAQAGSSGRIGIQRQGDRETGKDLRPLGSRPRPQRLPPGGRSGRGRRRVPRSRRVRSRHPTRRGRDARATAACGQAGRPLRTRRVLPGDHRRPRARRRGRGGGRRVSRRRRGTARARPGRGAKSRAASS